MPIQKQESPKNIFVASRHQSHWCWNADGQQRKSTLSPFHQLKQLCRVGPSVASISLSSLASPFETVPLPSKNPPSSHRSGWINVSQITSTCIPHLNHKSRPWNIHTTLRTEGYWPTGGGRSGVGGWNVRQWQSESRTYPELIPKQLKKGRKEVLIECERGWHGQRNPIIQLQKTPCCCQ